MLDRACLPLSSNAFLRKRKLPSSSNLSVGSGRRWPGDIHESRYAIPVPLYGTCESGAGPYTRVKTRFETPPDGSKADLTRTASRNRLASRPERIKPGFDPPSVGRPRAGRPRCGRPQRRRPPAVGTQCPSRHLNPREPRRALPPGSKPVLRPRRTDPRRICTSVIASPSRLASRPERSNPVLLTSPSSQPTTKVQASGLRVQEAVAARRATTRVWDCGHQAMRQWPRPRPRASGHGSAPRPGPRPRPLATRPPATATGSGHGPRGRPATCHGPFGHWPGQRRPGAATATATNPRLRPPPWGRGPRHVGQGWGPVAPPGPLDGTPRGTLRHGYYPISARLAKNRFTFARGPRVEPTRRHWPQPESPGSEAQRAAAPARYW